MRTAQVLVAMFCLLPVRLLAASANQTDMAADLKSCELKLKDNYTIRRTVVWPDRRFGVSVDSGGANSLDETWHWPYSKAKIVGDLGLGDAALQTIESAVTVDRDVSGDASASVDLTGDGILVNLHLHKILFGGGATAMVRIQLVLRQSDSDATIISIGQICAAKVLGHSSP